jgi:aspartate/methionine/tyrosine aminotransferase
VRAWGEEFPASAARPLLDVSQAVPSYPPPDSVLAHVRAAVAGADAATYTPIAGLATLRSALAGHLSTEYQAPIEPALVAVTAGCNQAFCVALMAIAGPGDEVLLPLPYYFNHDMWLTMQGVRGVHVPFVEADPTPDVERLEALVTARTRALVLVTPNNPTGAHCDSGRLEAIADWAAARRITLILDETYKDFRGVGAGPAHALFRRPDWTGHLVQLYSFSKAYSLAAFRVGSLVCGPRLMAEVLKILDCIAICAPRIGQEAALHALQNAAVWRDEKAREMAGRLEHLRLATRANALGYRVVSAGAYFAYVRHPFVGQPSRGVARRLAREHGVLCVPGSAFGPGQDDYLRFAFANLEPSAYPELVERLVESAA